MNTPVGKVDLRRPSRHRTGALQRSSQLVSELVDELVRRRRESGLSQAQVAELIGTSQRTLSQLENHAQEPKLSTVVAWALAVGARLSWGDDEQTGQAVLTP